MKTFLLCAASLLLPTLCSAGDLVDNFAKPQMNGRLAERGAWTFENNEARCVANPELYKKYHNHGPILKWSREFKDANIEFEMKASKCQRVVFTLNGDGHVFRVSLVDNSPKDAAGTAVVPTRGIAWATKSSKENKGDTIKFEKLPDLPAINGKWVKVKLVVSGEKGVLTIGDSHVDVNHAALTRDKNTVTLSFASGELAVRNFRMSTP